MFLFPQSDDISGGLPQGIGFGRKNKSAISIIGGVDGPTSVLIAGRNGKKPFKERNHLRESLIIRHKPDLLGEQKEISKPDIYTWDSLGISYCGSKKVVKRFRKIAHDLYIYYGVTEEDIKNKSERYSSLLATLST